MTRAAIIAFIASTATAHATPAQAVVVEGAIVAREDGQLEVSYRVTNRGRRAVWVLDVYFDEQEDERYTQHGPFFVGRTAVPGTLYIGRGYYEYRADVEWPPDAVMRRLPPRQSLAGTGTLRMPLRYQEPPVVGSVLVGFDHAVIEIGIVERRGSGDSMRLADGTLVVDPSWEVMKQQRRIRSAPIALPAGASPPR